MQYAVFTQDPADRPSPGGIGARPVQNRWTIERGAIQIPKHQLLFPVGEAKGPCEIEVYSLESKLYGSFLCLCPGTTMSSLALFLCGLMEELLHT